MSDCITTHEASHYPRERFLYFLAEWEAVWQTQEYLGRSHNEWWSAGRRSETGKPLTDELKASLREFHDGCTA